MSLLPPASQANFYALWKRWIHSGHSGAGSGGDEVAPEKQATWALGYHEQSHTHTHTHTHARTHTHTRTHACTHTHTYTHSHMHAHTRKHKHTMSPGNIQNVDTDVNTLLCISLTVL